MVSFYRREGIIAKMTDAQYETLRKEMVACQRCLEAGYDITPGAIFSGQPTADIMLIGQAPGITEVQARRPFNAGSGTRLFLWLASAGLDESRFRDNQYMTAVTKCFPGKSQSGKGDRVPSRQEQIMCRGYLIRELQLVNPKVILPVGSLAIQLFVKKPWRLDEVIGKIIRWADTGDQISLPLELPKSSLVTELPESLPQNGRWIIPLPHPSGASLWPNREQNRLLIEKAVRFIAEVSTIAGKTRR